MAKSGFKIIGVAVVMLVIGGPLAKETDYLKGDTASLAISVSVLLLFTGAALLLLGLFKVIAGIITKT